MRENPTRPGAFDLIIRARSMTFHSMSQRQHAERVGPALPRHVRQFEEDVPEVRAVVLGLPAGPSDGCREGAATDGVDPQEAALIAGRMPNEAGWDEEPPEMSGTLTTRDGEQRIPTTPSNFVRYYENIRDVIAGRAALAVTPEQALNVMHGLELAVESSRQRCTLSWPR